MITSAEILQKKASVMLRNVNLWHNIKKHKLKNIVKQTEIFSLELDQLYLVDNVLIIKQYYSELYQKINETGTKPPDTVSFKILWYIFKI